MTWAAVAIGGSAVLGAYSASQAADAQSDAAGKASGVTLDMFNKTRQDLSPWMQSGGQANDLLSYYMGLGGSGSGSGAAGPPTQQQFTTMTGSPGTPGEKYTDFSGAWLTPPTPSTQQSQFNQAGYDAAMAQWQQQQGQQQGQQQNDPRFGSLLKPFSLADFQQSPAYQFNLQQGQMAIDKSANARGNLYAPQTLQDLGKYQQGLASNEFQNAFSNYNTNQGNIYARLYGMSGAGQNAAAQTGGFGAAAAQQVGNNTMGAGNAQAAGYIGGANAISAGVGQYYNNQFLNQFLQNQQKSTVAGTNTAGGNI